MSRPLSCKILSALCATALLLTLTPAAFAAGFTDVKIGDWFYDAVNWAVANDITSGTSTTTFSPNQTCNNAQILTFLWRAAGKPSANGSNPFRNVSSSNYYYQPALWASEKGLISGSSFDASAPCTRAMAVTYIWKAKNPPLSMSPASFSDVPAEQVELSIPVAWAVENGITSGTGSNTFSPDKTCTRAEIVTFLLRAYGGGAVTPSTGSQTENDPCAELIRLINAERKKAGLAELETSAALAKAAQMRSDDLSKGYFDNRPDGSDWFSVVDTVGIAAEDVDESIIGGSSKASDMFAAAMQAPDAYAAMHSSEYTHVAAGYTYTPNGYGGYQDFWSVLYIIGTPASSALSVRASQALPALSPRFP